MRGRLAIAAALLALSLGVAQAAPGSISDCERISEPDAYNNCLAAFGPTARGGGTGRLAPAPPMGRRGARRARQQPARHNGVTVERKGGRVRAIIELKK